jgi:tetratricopeptide (TPR) repeat protein
MNQEEYVTRVLQPAESSWPPDVFTRYGLDLDVSSTVEIQRAIQLTRALWGPLTRHPVWGGKIGHLQKEASTIESQLLDATARERLRSQARARRAEVDKARFSWLDDLIALDSKAFQNALPKARVTALVDSARSKGISEREVIERLRIANVRIIASQPGVRPAVSWLDPPTELAKLASVRKDLLRDLSTLGHQRVTDFLGVRDDATSAQLKAAREKRSAEWASRAANSERAIAQNVLSKVKLYLKDDPRIYRLMRSCDLDACIREFFDATCVGGRIDVEREKYLCKRAAVLGFSAGEAHDAIVAIANERGVVLESDHAPATVKPSTPSARRDVPRPTSQPIRPAVTQQQPRRTANRSSSAPDFRRFWTKVMGAWREARDGWPHGWLACGCALMATLAASGSNFIAVVILGGVGALAARRNLRDHRESQVGRAGLWGSLGIAAIGILAGSLGKESSSPAQVAAPPAMVPAVAPVAPAPSHATREQAERENTLGSKLAKQKRWPEAIEHYRQATTIDANYSEAWSNLAWAQYQNGSSAEEALAAVASGRAAVQPSEPRILASLAYTQGRIVEERGDLAEARRLYEESLAARPRHKSAVVALEILHVVDAPRMELVGLVQDVFEQALLDPSALQALSGAELSLLESAPHARVGKRLAGPGGVAFYYAPTAPAGMRRQPNPDYRESLLSAADNANLRLVGRFKRAQARGDELAPRAEEASRGDDPSSAAESYGYMSDLGMGQPKPPTEVDPPQVRYRARLGPADHFDDLGARLALAEHVVRQDRLRLHSGRSQDPEDEPDPRFVQAFERNRLSSMLAKSLSPAARERIVKTDPLVEVAVWSDRVELRVLD